MPAIQEQPLSPQTAVLGSLLINGDVLAGEIMQRVTAEDFSSAEYRTIFAAINGVFLSGKPVDPVIVLDKLGKPYEQLLRDIMTATPSYRNWDVYCDLMRDQALLRRMQEVAMQVLNAESAEEARDSLGKAERLLVTKPGTQIITLQQGLNDFLDRQGEGKVPDYLDWGINSISKRVWVESGDFVVLGADSSVGKTALALQFAFEIARGGKRVGFFSLETPRNKIIDRVVAQQARVPMPNIKQRTLSISDFNAVSELGERSYDYALEVIPCSGASVSDIRAITLARGYNVIFIDYLQLLESDNKGARWETVAQLSMGLHRMAASLGVTVVALSQMTLPDNHPKEYIPTVFDLRESKQIRNDAEVIMLMGLKNEDEPSGDRVFVVGKNKDGALGRVTLHFDPETLTFYAGRTSSDQVQMKELKERAAGENPFTPPTDNPYPYDAPLSGMKNVPKSGTERNEK